ncbi:AI-2E family transporter [Candidatus Saccharibacteria bacterium]|nr:AI-2E family transporter [Candidatus Saccharibacteria bacterium]
MSRTIEVDTKTFFRFWIVLAVLSLIIAMILWAAEGLIIVGLSIFLAIAIKPLANKLDRIDKKKSRPALTAITAVAIVFIVVGTAVAIIGPMVANETVRFVKQAPEMIQNSVGGLDGVNKFFANFGVDNFSDQAITAVKSFSSDFVKNASGILVSGIGTVTSFLTGLVLTIVLTVLFMVQGPGLVDWLRKKVTGKNTEAGKLAARILSKTAGVISKYVTGQVLVGVLDGIVVGLTTFVLSLIFGFSSGFAFPMALIAAVFYLIPMFGPIISCGLISLLLIFQNPIAGGVFLVFYIVYLQIENNIIAPKVQGNSLKLPTLVILVSITIGMYAFGLLGAIISIPIAGVIKVLIDEYPNIKALRD